MGGWATPAGAASAANARGWAARGRGGASGGGRTGQEGPGGGDGKKALKSSKGQRRPALLCCAPAAREGALAAGELRMGPWSPEP